MNNNQNIKSLLSEAWRARGREDYDRAQDILMQASELCPEDQYYSLGRIERIKGQIACDQDRYEEGYQYYQAALQLYKMTNDEDVIAHTERHVADVLCEMDRLDEAGELYRSALSRMTSNSNDNSMDLANVKRAMAVWAQRSKRTSEAVTLWKEVSELYAAFGIQEGVDEANENLRKLLPDH